MPVSEGGRFRSDRLELPAVLIAPGERAGLRRGVFGATCFFRAVAENQPGENKNRMITTKAFSGIATRLREFIQVAGCGSELEPPYVGCYEPGFCDFALELFGLQYEHNAPYRRFCQARGVRPETLDDWRRVPAIPTVAFKELELSCLPPEARTAVFYSSGTTGQRPSRHFHNAESLAIYEASLLAWFGANVFRNKLKLELQAGSAEFEVQALASAPEPARTIEKPMIFLTPSSLLAQHSSLTHMFDTVQREFGSPESVFVGSVAEDGAWTLDLKATLDTLGTGVRDGQPVVMLGTAFSFVHLLDHLGDQRLHFELPPGSLALETGGYKSRSRSLPKTELHSLITQRLGISPAYIICEYGMSELSSQAYARSVRDGWRVTGEAATDRHSSSATRHMQFPPWCRVQIISPETGREAGEGESGLIRVFDLANVYSVMAIQTEDLGVRRGDGFELIGRAELAEPRGCSLMALENFRQ